MHRARQSTLALVAAAAIAVALGGRTAGATTLLRLPIEEMTRRSDLVLRATVADVRVIAGPADDRRATTYVTFQVHRALKGHAAAPTLTIRLLGGATSRHVLAVPGTPVFRPGEEVIVFLEATRDGYKPMGLSLGKYTVTRDAAGRETARRSVAGAQVVLPDGTPGDAVSHADDAMDLGALLRAIEAGRRLPGRTR